METGRRELFGDSSTAASFASMAHSNSATSSLSSTFLPKLQGAATVLGKCCGLALGWDLCPFCCVIPSCSPSFLECLANPSSNLHLRQPRSIQRHIEHGYHGSTGRWYSDRWPLQDVKKCHRSNRVSWIPPCDHSGRINLLHHIPNLYSSEPSPLLPLANVPAVLNQRTLAGWKDREIAHTTPSPNPLRRLLARRISFLVRMRT